jgi:hypothetical protein
MKKYLSVFLVLSVAVLFATSVFGVPANKAPESVTIKEAAKKQAPVTFTHGAHGKLTKCETCHHMQKGLVATATTEVQLCSTCHMTPEKATTPKMTEMAMDKNPFHMVCIKCHKDGAKGPTKCMECHKK